MNTQPVKVGEWLPDLPEHNNPGATEAKNCVAEAMSYRDFKALQTFSDALDNPCVGAFWLQSSGGTVFNFAGDDTKLYRLDSNSTWTNVSQAGDYTGVTNWEFTKFGDRVIAVNINDVPQYYDVGVSSLFADLPGSPPNAKHIAVVRDFIVLGSINDGSTRPGVIEWSGFNNSEQWTASLATQQSQKELFGRGGEVQRIVPGEYGVIFQEHSIWRMDYVGPPIVFQLNEVERGRGTPAPNSVAWTGRQVFYYGHDGFYVFDGVKSTPIGVNRVDRWFAAHADASTLASMRAAVDRQNRLVLWAYSSSGSSTQNDRILIYNWGANRWSWVEIDTQCVAEYGSSGLTLDDLDTVLADIDAESIPVDSDIYKGGSLNVLGFTTANQAGTFSGAALEGVVETGEFKIPGRRTVVNAVRPLVEGSNTGCTVHVGTRNTTDAAVDWGSATTLNAIGEARVRKNSRYQRYRITMTNGFDYAQGVEVDGRQAGKR